MPRQEPSMIGLSAFPGLSYLNHTVLAWPQNRSDGYPKIGLDYSCRRASTGSILAARSAG